MAARGGAGGAGLPTGSGVGTVSVGAPLPPLPGLTGNPTTIADGAQATIRLDVKADPAYPFNYIVSIAARPDGNYLLSSVADSGPIWCEVYIKKGPLTELVDKGYVRLAYARGGVNVVGMIGVIPIDPTAVVFATFANDSGTSEDVRLDVETQATLSPLQPSRSPLSTMPTAIWEFKGTILENAASGNHTLTVAPGAGDEIGFLWGAIKNGDAAGRNAFAAIQDSVPVSSFSLLSVTGAAVSIASGVTQNLPNTTSTSASMTGQFIRFPDQLALELDAVLITITTTFWVWCRISGRKPVSTLASTGAAPTLTKVIDRVQ